MVILNLSLLDRRSQFFGTGGSCLSRIFWEHENQSNLLVIWLIYIKLYRKKETKFWEKIQAKWESGLTAVRLKQDPPVTSLCCSLKMKLKKSYVHALKILWIGCIANQMHKEIIKPLFPMLTKIINLLLIEGLFVEEWKVVIIPPLLKKLGLDLISNNYRPVSNLPFLSKVVEKCALKQFTKHCVENGLLSTYQSAYRKNYSCETALVKHSDDLLWLME